MLFSWAATAVLPSNCFLSIITNIWSKQKTKITYSQFSAACWDVSRGFGTFGVLSNEQRFRGFRLVLQLVDARLPSGSCFDDWALFWGCRLEADHWHLYRLFSAWRASLIAAVSVWRFLSFRQPAVRAYYVLLHCRPPILCGFWWALAFSAVLRRFYLASWVPFVLMWLRPVTSWRPHQICGFDSRPCPGCSFLSKS